MSREFNVENLENAVKKMDERIPIARQKGCPIFLKLSNFAIGLGFTAQSAEEFIKQELEKPS